MDEKKMKSLWAKVTSYKIGSAQRYYWRSRYYEYIYIDGGAKIYRILMNDNYGEYLKNL